MSPALRLLLGLGLITIVTASLQLDIGQNTQDDDDEPEDDNAFDPENLIGEKWHYMDDGGDKVGPMFFEDVKSDFFLGKLNLMSRVWQPAWEKWRMYKTIPGLRTYLKQNLDVKQQLQLIAVDDMAVVQEIRRAEQMTPGGPNPLDSAMLCSKGTALAEVLRRGISKSVLKEITRDAVAMEVERVKILKAIRALRYRVAIAEKERAARELPIRRELAKYIKALKLMREKTRAEADADSGGGSGGVFAAFAGTSVGEELQLLRLVAEEDPSVLVEPGMAVLSAILIVALLGKLFLLQIQVLRSPIGPPPPVRKSNESGKESKKESKKESNESDAAASGAAKPKKTANK